MLPVPIRWPFSAPSDCWRRRRCVWNWSTQIGAIAATTALLAVLSANVFAVLPSMNPPQLKPTPSVANAPRAAPCRSCFSDSPWYHADVGTRLSSQFGEEGFLYSEHGATNMNRDSVFALQCEQWSIQSMPPRIVGTTFLFCLSARLLGRQHKRNLWS